MQYTPPPTDVDFASVNAALAAASAPIDVNNQNVINAGTVGIGTTNPDFKTTIAESDDTIALAITSPLDTPGNWTGLAFGDSTFADGTYKKAGILFERTTTYNRGSIHIAQSNSANAISAGLSDAVLTVDTTGDVGIGTTSLPATGGNPCMAFADAGSNPATIGANTAVIFAKDVAGTVEFFAMDEAAAATQLTQHAKDAPDAAYVDPVNGKGIEWLARREIPWQGLDGTKFGRPGEILDGVVYWQRPGESTKWVESFAEYNARVSPSPQLVARDQSAEVDAAAVRYTSEYNEWKTATAAMIAHQAKLPPHLRIDRPKQKPTLRQIGQNPYA